jgi:hypothetical protein
MTPGKYVIETGLQECQQTFQVNPHVRQSMRHGGSYTPYWVDINSELSGLTRKATLCPELKFLPGTKAKYEETIVHPEDSLKLNTEDTKLSNPPCTLRETGINRWEWLCEDPQTHALSPFDQIGLLGASNRLLVKDQYRPCMPTPLPQDAAWPPRENNQYEVKYTMDSCA